MAVRLECGICGRSFWGSGRGSGMPLCPREECRRQRGRERSANYAAGIRLRRRLNREAMRTCLVCGKKFRSRGPGHRMHEACQAAVAQHGQARGRVTGCRG